MQDDHRYNHNMTKISYYGIIKRNLNGHLIIILRLYNMHFIICDSYDETFIIILVIIQK
jgi:hypothetical protein